MQDQFIFLTLVTDDTLLSHLDLFSLKLHALVVEATTDLPFELFCVQEALC